MAYEALTALDALQSGVNTIAGAPAGLTYALNLGNQIAAYWGIIPGYPNYYVLPQTYLDPYNPSATLAQWQASDDPWLIKRGAPDNWGPSWWIAVAGAYADLQTGISTLQNLPDSPCPGIGGYGSFSDVASSMIAVAQRACTLITQVDVPRFTVMGSAYEPVPPNEFAFVTQAATDAYNTCITIAGANWQACQADYDGTLNTYYGPNAAVGVDDGGDGDSGRGSPNDYSTN